MFCVQDFHFLWLDFPVHSATLPQWGLLSSTPAVLLHPVWPLPISLATTFGISFDFSSSPYLDVSVQAVPFIYLCIQYMICGFESQWFPNSDICGYAYLQLTAAFRSLSRPSSALSAKASSLRPYQLNLYSLPTVETVPDSHHHLYSVTNDGLLLSRIC